jgi:hypothetical protein
MHRLFSTRHTLHSDTHYIRTQILSGLTWILFYSIFRSATLTFQNVRKKNFKRSKYALYTLSNKHICWNNFRDHLVDFDWQHMFTYVTEHLNNPDSPIKMSTEAISYATVSKYARQELTSRKILKFLSQSRL